LLNVTTRVMNGFLHLVDLASVANADPILILVHLGLSLGGDGGSHGRGHLQRQPKGSREAVRVSHYEGSCEKYIIFKYYS
jgi:hypothetical protein